MSKEETMVEAKPEKPIYCSFCGKNQHETAVMIKAVMANICDECVGLAVDLVAERRAMLSKAKEGAGE
jgi:ATP-dependent Clp protease ATP-binding subunit ClpX